MTAYDEIARELGRPALTRFQAILVPFSRWYLGLMPLTLPEYYENRKPFQRSRMEYDDECSPGGFHAFYDGDLKLTGKDVLDFGCGFGGRTVRFKELGARSVYGTEIIPEMAEEARKFAEFSNADITIVKIDEGKPLPFPDQSFDVICSYDVFEHVGNMRDALRECYRLLRPGGSLYAVFPPYHHPTGGSHLHTYISRSPFPNLFFPSPTLVIAAEQLMRARNQQYRTPVFRPTDPLWAVNGMTLAGFHRLMREFTFAKVKCHHSPIVSPFRSKWERWRMKYYSLPFKIAANIPLLWELFTDRIVVTATR